MRPGNLIPAVQAPPGSNPFPGADAGVYTVADPPTFVSRAALSVDVVPLGPLWLSAGSNSWVRLLASDVADVTELPVAQAEEIFATGCLVTDGAGTFWRGDGTTGWIRIATKPAANAAALPVPASGETFSTDLLCLTADLGVVYKWDGAAWVLP